MHEPSAAHPWPITAFRLIHPTWLSLSSAFPLLTHRFVHSTLLATGLFPRFAHVAQGIYTGLYPALSTFKSYPALLTRFPTGLSTIWSTSRPSAASRIEGTHASEVVLLFSMAYTWLLHGLSAGFSTSLSTNKKAGIVIPACSGGCPHVYPHHLIWAS